MFGNVEPGFGRSGISLDASAFERRAGCHRLLVITDTGNTRDDPHKALITHDDRPDLQPRATHPENVLSV
jgi:hypothetical protein